MSNHDEITRLLTAGGGVILRRDHPQLAEPLKWLVRTGQLVAILPGTYVMQGSQHDPVTRIHAMSR